MQVHVRRSVTGREDVISSENGDPSHLAKPFKPLVRKSKLVVVDLAGSERVHKSGITPTYDLFHWYTSHLYVYKTFKFISNCFSIFGMFCMCVPHTKGGLCFTFTWLLRNLICFDSMLFFVS